MSGVHIVNGENSKDVDSTLNPLVPVVLRLLRQFQTGISEYELLKQLEQSADLLLTQHDDAQLALFQKHFLLMNALYQLQDVLWREEQVWLTISPLNIVIEYFGDPIEAQEQALAADSSAALRDYYLDWNQFRATDSAAVAQLLAGFWQHFHAHDRRADALATLQLDTDASWREIKTQYRRLAAATHPDRGGDNERFLAIREAYEILRGSFAMTARMENNG